MEIKRAPAQRLDIEKPNRRGGDIAGTEGEFALFEEMVEIDPDVIWGELIGGSPIGRSPVVLGKVSNGFGIGSGCRVPNGAVASRASCAHAGELT